MKYCIHCGKELMDEAVFCPCCGCPVEQVKLNVKYCTHCGRELMDEAVICPGCGCPANQVMAKMNVKDNKNALDIKPSMAALEILIAIMLPIVGFILGIIGVTKKNTTSRYKNTFLITLIVSIVAWIIWAIIFINT